MNEWQPIETAPKDGSHILAWSPEWETLVTIRWFEEWGRWVLNAALIDLENSGEPTHWMPLPPPPAD